MRFAATVLAATCLAAMTPAFADGMTMSHPRQSASGADAANAAAMDRMMSDMHVEPSGDADKDFARMMLAHHRGAIAMAKVELRYGKNPEMRRLAAGIIKAQEAEIAQMEGWLARK